jgi:hypothetical protein
MPFEPETPVCKEFRLFTGGKEPGIDAIAIMCELLKDLPPNEMQAALQYVADKHGFSLQTKRS